MSVDRGRTDVVQSRDMVIRRPSIRRLFFLFLLLVAGCAEAGNSWPGEPLLWTVESPGGAAGWLFGTLHQGVSLQGDLSEAIAKHLQLADSLTLEADMRDASVQDFLAMVRLPADQVLDSLMPSSTWAKLIALLPTVSASQLRALRPWYVSSLLVQILTPSQARLEDELLEAASSAQKGLSFLETWQLQAALMNDLSPERALAQLIEAVENAAAVKQGLQSLIEAYQGGDLENVARAGLAAGAYPAQDSPEYDPLLRKRNQAWLPLIQEKIDSGSSFIAVGFGHLLGPDGLLQMLGAQGYPTSRVR
jgi:uncharacterized protein